MGGPPPPPPHQMLAWESRMPRATVYTSTMTSTRMIKVYSGHDSTERMSLQKRMEGTTMAAMMTTVMRYNSLRQGCGWGCTRG